MTAEELAEIRKQHEFLERSVIRLSWTRMEIERAALLTHTDAQAQRIAELTHAMAKSNDEITQVLGKALKYPWFKDDQNNFPGATEENGVCVGDHVAESLADESAKRIAELEAERDALSKALSASCIEEREMLWEACPGGGCERALKAEAQLAARGPTREELLIRAIQAKAACPVTGESCTEPHECTCVRQAKADGYGN